MTLLVTTGSNTQHQLVVGDHGLFTGQADVHPFLAIESACTVDTTVEHFEVKGRFVRRMSAAQDTAADEEQTLQVGVVVDLQIEAIGSDTSDELVGEVGRRAGKVETGLEQAAVVDLEQVIVTKVAFVELETLF